jgi:hypothetical protein
MKNADNHRRKFGRLLWLLITLLSTSLFAKPGEMTLSDHEQTFPVLETRTGAYTNVTVTKKTKDWIFILHSKGVCNVRASDLSPDARIMLGYDAIATNNAAEVAQQQAANDAKPLAQLTQMTQNLKFSKVKDFVDGWRQNQKEKMAEVKSFIAANPKPICIALGSIAGLYILLATCFWLICRKTHNAPGPLVWVPILQLIPLLRAANMPRVWFFAYFVPLLNIIALIVWCIKIVKSRGKSPWVAFLLVLPLTSFFAFLYLAFSRSAPVQMETHELLALETA